MLFKYGEKPNILETQIAWLSHRFTKIREQSKVLKCTKFPRVLDCCDYPMLPKIGVSRECVITL